MAETTMKLSRASKRELKLDKLCHSMRSDRDSLEKFRENRLAMIRLDAGADWSENAARLRRPYNGISLYKQVMRRALINQTPRVMLSTWKKEHKPTVRTAQEWANRQFKKVKLGEHLDRAITDALFWMGVMKVGVTTPVDSERKGFTTWAGEVFAESVDPDDFGFDMRARVYEECTHVFHRYSAGVEVANRQFGLRGENKLEGEPAHEYDEDGNERVGMVARGWDGGHADPYRERADMWEVWVPHMNALVTFRSSGGGLPGGEDDFVEAREYVGPYCGPYTIFGFIPVPGQLPPKGPIADQIGLDVTVNSMLRKLIRQAERFKQLDLFSGQADEDMKKIREADDGETVQCSRPNDIKPWMSTPPNPQLFALMLQFKQLHNQVCGNLEVIAGLARQAGTAAQESQLNANAVATVDAMQRVSVSRTSKVMEDMLWYWWHDRTGEMNDYYRLDSDPNEGVFRTVGPEERSGLKWEDLECQVDPYSMVSDTPANRLQHIRSLVNMAIPIAPFLSQQGTMLDAQFWLKKEGEYANNPDVVELFKLGEPQESGEGEPDQLGQSPVTSRTYTRKSESEATQDGEERDMIQKMMGAGANGAGDFGGMMK